MMKRRQTKKQARIHPAIACCAILCLTLLCISAEFHSEDALVSFKLVIVAIMAAIAGIKVRHVLPVT